MRMLRHIGLYLALIVAVVLGTASLAHADPVNLVTNGNFTQTTLSSPGGFFCNNTHNSTCSSSETDWSGNCSASGCQGTGTPSSILFPGTNGSAFNGGFGLSAMSNSPLGAAANIFADDGDSSYSMTISQLVNGLIIGQMYNLTFYQSSSTQSGTNAATTEFWNVVFGGNTVKSATMTTPSGTATSWVQQSFTFAATAVSETLSFLSGGTPAGDPPVALLTGVSVIQVPEPASYAIMAVGLLGLWRLAPRRRARD
jgi:hypothetical protein